MGGQSGMGGTSTMQGGGFTNGLTQQPGGSPFAGGPAPAPGGSPFTNALPRANPMGQAVGGGAPNPNVGMGSPGASGGGMGGGQPMQNQMAQQGRMPPIPYGGGQTNALPGAPGGMGGMNPGLAAMFMGGAAGRAQQPGQTLPQIMQPQQSRMPEISQMMQNQMGQQGPGQQSRMPEIPYGGQTNAMPRVGGPTYEQRMAASAGSPREQFFGPMPHNPAPQQAPVTNARAGAQPSRAQLLARQMNQAAARRR